MRVRAIAMGYYADIRIRPGQVFEMDEKTASAKKGKDGKPELPSWVEPADRQSQAKKLKLPGAKVVSSKRAAQGALHEPKNREEDDGEVATGDEDVI